MLQSHLKHSEEQEKYHTTLFSELKTLSSSSSSAPSADSDPTDPALLAEAKQAEQELSTTVTQLQESISTLEASLASRPGLQELYDFISKKKPSQKHPKKHR